MQAALVARTFAISADHKVRVGCGALDIAGTRRTSACRRSDCTVAETGRKRRSKRPDKARLACAPNQQLQDIFKIGRDQADGHQLIEGGSEERPRVLYIWVAAIAAGFGMAIGAIQASHYLSCRRLCRTIVDTTDTSHIPPSAPVDIQSNRTS